MTVNDCPECGHGKGEHMGPGIACMYGAGPDDDYDCDCRDVFPCTCGHDSGHHRLSPGGYCDECKCEGLVSP